MISWEGVETCRLEPQETERQQQMMLEAMDSKNLFFIFIKIIFIVRLQRYEKD